MVTPLVCLWLRGMVCCCLSLVDGSESAAFIALGLGTRSAGAVVMDCCCVRRSVWRLICLLFWWGVCGFLLAMLLSCIGGGVGDSGLLLGLSLILNVLLLGLAVWRGAFVREALPRVPIVPLVPRD